MRGTDRLLIFAWHNIQPTWCFPAEPGAGLKGFRNQLKAIRRFGNVVPLGPALAALNEGRPLPPRSVALTFDDGYRDNLTHAVPELERFGMPATIFLVPQLISREITAWWEELYWAFTTTRVSSLEWNDQEIQLGGLSQRQLVAGKIAEELKLTDTTARTAAVAELVATLDPAEPSGLGEMFLDAEECCELRDRGVELGSHSARHAILSQETADAQKHDLSWSRLELERLLGINVDLLAYPNGEPKDFNSATIEAAEHAGYQNAMTSIKGRNSSETPRFEVRRIIQYPELGVLSRRRVARFLSKRTRNLTERAHAVMPVGRRREEIAI